MKIAWTWIKRVLLILFVGVLLFQIWMLRGSHGRMLRRNRLANNYQYSSTPTLMIPGWGGGTWSTDKMIQTFQRKNIGQKLMTIWVFPNGKTIVHGHYQPGQKNVLIQLLYVWNCSASYHPQVRELSAVLKDLHQRYHITKLNIVAHSYGGTEFIHAYLGSKYIQRMIDFRKIVFLGVPVDESFGTKTRYRWTLAKRSTDDNFKKLEKEAKAVHTHHNDQVFNLMGSKDQQRTDGSVPHVQSEMLRNLLKDTGARYFEHVYPRTSHPMLHQKSNIINDVAHDLWGY